MASMIAQVNAIAIAPLKEARRDTGRGLVPSVIVFTPLVPVVAAEANNAAQSLPVQHFLCVQAGIAAAIVAALVINDYLKNKKRDS
jgi:hypothetical protein